MSPRSERSLTVRKGRPASAGRERPFRAGAERAPGLGAERASRTGTERASRMGTERAAGTGTERASRTGAARTGAGRAGAGRAAHPGDGAADQAWGERTLLDPSTRPRTGSADRRRAAARSRRVPFALLLAGVIAAGMCALLALNTATAASEVRERHVDAANASLSAKQEQLSRAVAVIQAPASLSLLAARLGLVPAGSPAFLRLNADGTVTVLGAPAKVPTPPVPLTPAQQAAAKAAIAKAAKDKAAKANAAAKAKAAATTPSTTTPSTKTPTTTTPTTKTPTTKTPTTKTTSTKTSPTKTSPTKASPASPVKPKATAVPTVTLPGGPR